MNALLINEIIHKHERWEREAPTGIAIFYVHMQLLCSTMYNSFAKDISTGVIFFLVDDFLKAGRRLEDNNNIILTKYI